MRLLPFVSATYFSYFCRLLNGVGLLKSTKELLELGELITISGVVGVVTRLSETCDFGFVCDKKKGIEKVVALRNQGQI